MRSPFFAITVVLVLGAIVAVIDRWPGEKIDQKASIVGKVVRVVDGDSLYLKGLETQIRLFGVDAPERGERDYHEAKAILKSLALGSVLSCNQIDEDRFKRIVARCFDKDGSEINRLMIESDTVLEYCRFSKGLYGHC